MSTTRERAPAALLFLHHGQDWIRGSERCLLDLAQHVDRSRFRPVVLCNAPALAAAARALGVPAYETTGWDESGSRLFPSRERIREIREIVERHAVRLIHANNPMPLKAALPIARRSRLPLLCHLHLIYSTETRRYLAMHQASMSVGVSEAAIAGLRDDGTPAARLRVIHNGIDQQRLLVGSTPDLRATLGIAPDDIVMVAVGSLIDRKGIDRLIAVAERLGDAPRPHHLVLLGDGPERARFEAQTRVSTALGRVHFLGERGDVGAVLRSIADLMVSGAREEAFPLNLLEAAAVGLPLVVSDIAAHREAVVAGQTGLLVDADDPAAFAANVLRLSGDAEGRRRMGDAGRRRIESQFLLEHYVRHFEATYDELLARPRSEFGWVRGATWPRAYWRWLWSAGAGRLRRRPAASG